MTVLYVKEPGAVIRRDVERIKVTRRPPEKRVDELLHSIAVRDLEQVVIYGNVQLTTQAAALLLENNVDVVYLSHYGKFRGRLGQDGSKFARLRHAQLRLVGDERRALELALAIVAAKLSNQRNVLQRLAANTAGRRAPQPGRGRGRHRPDAHRQPARHDAGCAARLRGQGRRLLLRRRQAAAAGALGVQGAPVSSRARPLQRAAQLWLLRCCKRT
jgi:hypothetical protein